MNKSEVYSWRITPQIKRTLEQAARREGTSVAILLERITREWILSRQGRDDDEETQMRLHASVSKSIGAISGENPNRSSRAKIEIRKRIAARHGR